MVNRLEQIKELLSTKGQITRRLADSNDCYCIEGIFCLAAGLAKHNAYDHVSFRDWSGSQHRHYAPPEVFAVLGLPQHVPTDTLERVFPGLPETNGLDSWGSLRLQDFEGGFSWLSLNDKLGLSFEQFATLLDTLNQSEPQC